MKKNEYMKPAVRVTKLMHKQCLLNGSPKVNTVSSNLPDGSTIDYGGASTPSNNTARGRQFDSWDEDEE